MDITPIACTLSAADLATRRAALRALRTACLEARRIDDGMSLRFASEPALLPRLAEVVDREQQCCRFLRFVLTVEPDGGGIQLEITGPPGTADFLDAELGVGPKESAPAPTRHRRPFARARSE